MAFAEAKICERAFDHWHVEGLILRAAAKREARLAPMTKQALVRDTGYRLKSNHASVDFTALLARLVDEGKLRVQSSPFAAGLGSQRSDQYRLTRVGYETIGEEPPIWL